MSLKDVFVDLGTAIERTTGVLHVNLAIGYCGRYLGTGDRAYLAMAWHEVEEAEKRGADASRAKDFMSRYQL